MKSRLILLCFLFYSSFSFSQQFLFNQGVQGISLPELQKQLKDFTDTAETTKAKNWKYIKRWEDELSRHADAKGNPGDARAMHRFKANRTSRFKSANSFNANWLPTGPNYVPDNYTGYLENGIGRINCIAFHPTQAQVFYVGVAQGGLWKTTNGGISWIPLTDNLPITRVSDIAINPNNPDEIYISLCDFEYVGIGLDIDNRKRYPHYGLGVYKSMDGGLTWNPTGLSFELLDKDASLIRKIIINPENTNELIACGVNGIFRSVDAGTAWTQVSEAFYWDMLQQPGSSSVLYAAGGWLYNANYGYAAIYKSTDFGLTWTELETGIPSSGEVQRIKLAVSPSNSEVVQAIAVNIESGLYGLYRSEDAGQTWTFSYPGLNILEGGDGTGTGGQGTYDLVLHIDNENAQKVYAGGVNLWMSEDGGQTFNPASHWTLYYGPTIHADMHYLTQHPLTAEYFMCNDGGVYKTSEILNHTWESAQNGNPWPSTWENLSNGMQVTSFYRISSDKQANYQLMAGAQDNATSYFDGNNWYGVFGGDGMDNHMSSQVPGVVIGSSQYGYFYWADDGGLSNVQGIQANVNDELADWTAPIEGCAVEPFTIYAGFENVSRSSDEGFSWEVPGFLNGDYTPITAIGVAPQNCDVLYACKRINYLEGTPSAFFVSDEAGASWTERTQGLPDSLFLSSVAVSPLNSNHVVVSIAAFGEGLKVFRSNDGGLNWQNISFNLPDVPVNMLKFLPTSDDIIAATDAGIFVLRSGSSQWIDESLGLPNVIVSDIEINEAANKIFVSTFGRGIWESDLNLLLTGNNSEACRPEFSVQTLGSTRFEITWNNDACPASFSRMEVFDIKGQKLIQRDISGNTVSVDLNSFPSGMFFVRLDGNNKAQVIKLLHARD